jgi:lariat debranching enzyme
MVRVAIVGCSHGLLDDIYATINFINEMDTSNPIQLLLCCGDFQSVRNLKDLESLACPPKYRELHTFYQYYKSEKKAPVLTIFIGGNHEASNYLQELHYGGWVAPNMFYLGAAGVVRVGNLRIAGISGIYKQQDYTAGHYERAPYDNSTLRSVYHVRELEVYQLAHLQRVDKKKIDVFLSHDWPRGIEQFGDLNTLLRRKPYFQQEIQLNTLGSPAGEYLLYQLRPKYWFSAHLHVKYAAIVRHAPIADTTAETDDTAPSQDVHEAQVTDKVEMMDQNEMTKFLALDKCMPRREFLQVLDIPTDSQEEDQEKEKELKIKFDLEWLAILRATHHLASSRKYAPRVPQDEMVIGSSDLQWIHHRIEEYTAEKKLESKKKHEWISDFVKTVPAHGQAGISTAAGNPQTDSLLELLKLPHVITEPFVGWGSHPVEDPNSIELDEMEDEVEVENEEKIIQKDPNELDIDDM